MQVGGVGSGIGDHGSSHYVTGCLHDHDISKENKGGMKMASAPMQSDAGSAISSEPAQSMSLAEMFREALSAGKSLWGRIWGGSAAGTGQTANADGGDRAAAVAEQVLAQVGDADVADRSARTMPHSNPYFTTAEQSDSEKQGVIHKVRARVREVSGQLTKRFFGAFSGRSSLNSHSKSMNSGQQRYKEDLRRRSRYREDGLEIDCVLTDDSYLLDSYDRRGEYSKLTTDTKV